MEQHTGYRTADAMESLKQPIRQHPGRAVLTGLASGVAVGASLCGLLRRGKKQHSLSHPADRNTKIGEVMSPQPAVVTPDSTLAEIASAMVEHDCGAIPVVQDQKNCHPVGIVTDRDIVCRVIAKNEDPKMFTARHIMSPCFTVSPDETIEDCCELMEHHQVRRMPVVDNQGRCIGIVSQADIARRTVPELTTELVQEVSRPLRAASA